MTIPAYSTLGINEHPLVDTWQKPKPYKDPIKTDFDGGNTRLRKLPGDDVYVLQFGILLTSAEYVIWENYAKVTLGNGCARFPMRVWDGTAMVLKTVQMVDGTYGSQPMPPGRVQIDLQLNVYPS